MARELTIHGYGEDKEATILLDDEDYDLASRWSWKLSGPGGYPRRTIRKGKGFTTLYLHQLLMGDTDRTTVVDHINGDKRDYRRQNLRRCSASENLVNQHTQNGICKVRGVSPHGSGFQARPQRNKERINLGTFRTVEEAGNAIENYDRINGYIHG